MPWTPAQRRLFGYQYSQGKISRAELEKRMSEGTRADVDKTGHATRKKTRRRMRHRS